MIGLVYGAWTASDGGRRDRLWWLVAGECAGVLTWIKYVAVLFGLAIGLAPVIRVWRARGPARAIQAGAIFAAGVLVVSAAAAAFLLASGAWPAFINHLEFLSGPFAVNRSLNDAVEALWLHLRTWLTNGYDIGPGSKVTVPLWEVLGYGFPVLIAMALYAVVARARNGALRLWALAWLVAGVEVVWQARYSSYHSMALLGPLIALASLALPRSIRPVRFAAAAAATVSLS